MYDKFEELCVKKGVSAYRVAKETGITTATLTNWKQKKYAPKLDKLQKIADYFKVPIDYFIGDTLVKTAPSLTPQEQRLLNSFHMLSDDMQDRILGLIEASAKDAPKRP